MSEFKAPLDIDHDLDVSPAPAPALPYEEPDWSDSPKKEFYFEIIKNGSILGKSGKISSNYLVAGRLPNCDIELDHPSASRYHAVVQFKGDICFIYDLASSHHTFLNKTQIETRKYVRVRVGDMIRFGASSRIYVLAGDKEEAEKREEALLVRDAQNKVAMDEKIDVAWGFKEDAYEGDEWGGIDVKTDVDVSLIPTDAYYLDDPKKALNMFMDNNGAESQITYNQAASSGVGPREFAAVLEITGLQGPLSATGKGKKKTHAERNACLQACYKLEKLGILRLQQGSAADRTKRLREEYLEEEMDNYLDNAVESKGGKKHRHEGPLVETLATLTEKRTLKLEELETLKSQLELSRSGTGLGDQEEEDELDAYMNKLNQKVKKDQEKNMEKQVQQIEKELSDLDKLVDLATPKGLNQPKNASISKPSASVSTSKSAEVVEKPKSLPKLNDHASLEEPNKDKVPKESSRLPFKGPSKAELSRHSLHREEDVVDFVPPISDESADEMAKKAAAHYGY